MCRIGPAIMSTDVMTLLFSPLSPMQAAMPFSRATSDGADLVFNSSVLCLEALSTLGARAAADGRLHHDAGLVGVASAVLWSVDVLDSGLVGAIVSHAVRKSARSWGPDSFGDRAAESLADPPVFITTTCAMAGLLRCIVFSATALWEAAAQSPSYEAASRRQMEDLMGEFQESAERLTIDVARLSAAATLSPPTDPQSDDSAAAVAPGSAFKSLLLSDRKLRTAVKSMGVDLNDEVKVDEFRRGFEAAAVADGMDHVEPCEMQPCKPAASPLAVASSEIVDSLESLGKILRKAACLFLPNPNERPVGTVCGAERLLKDPFGAERLRGLGTSLGLKEPSDGMHSLRRRGGWEDGVVNPLFRNKHEVEELD